MAGEMVIANGPVKGTWKSDVIESVNLIVVTSPTHAHTHTSLEKGGIDTH